MATRFTVHLTTGVSEDDIENQVRTLFIPSELPMLFKIYDFTLYPSTFVRLCYEALNILKTSSIYKISRVSIRLRAVLKRYYEKLVEKEKRCGISMWADGVKETGCDVDVKFNCSPGK